MCLRSDRADHFLASENQRGTGSWLDGILRFSFRKLRSVTSGLCCRASRAGLARGLGLLPRDWCSSPHRQRHAAKAKQSDRENCNYSNINIKGQESCRSKTFLEESVNDSQTCEFKRGLERHRKQM